MLQSCWLKPRHAKELGRPTSTISANPGGETVASNGRVFTAHGRYPFFPFPFSLFTFYLALAIALLFPQLLVGVTPAGRTGASFLKVSPSPVATGLGEAYVAQAGGPDGIWYNPAGAIRDSGWQVLAANNYHSAGAQNNFLAVSRGAGNWAFGATFQILSMDGYEARGAYPTVQPEGTFSTQDLALGITGVYAPLPSLAFGATVKSVYQKLDRYESGVWAYDFGVRWLPMPNVTAGLAVQNLANRPKYGIDPYPLPLTTRAGLAWTPGPWLGVDWRLEGDLVKPDWESFKGNFGVAAGLSEMFTLRLGGMVGYSTRSVTFGLGTRWKALDFDLSVVPYTGENLWSYRFGLRVRL